MKKALIIYAVIFALTLLVPALVCFTGKSSSPSQEMVSLFRGVVTVFVN